MSDSSDQNVSASPTALMPPSARSSAFARRVRSDFEKVLEDMDPQARAKEIRLLTKLFEEQPLLGLSAYWLESVPKANFDTARHMREWINLLCSLIEQYAAITNRKQTKGVSWKSDCLKGMLDRLKRMPGKSWDGRNSWNAFTEALIAEAKPSTKNPVTKAFFIKGNRELESFRKLGIFLRDGNDIWKGNYDFPLKLLQELNQAPLRQLLATGSKHEKKIAHYAMRMDLLKQQLQHRAGLKKQLPAWETLRRLVEVLGDLELAKRADEALMPFQPLGDSLVANLEAAGKSNISRQRRPNAKPRKSR